MNVYEALSLNRNHTVTPINFRLGKNIGIGVNNFYVDFIYICTYKNNIAHNRTNFLYRSYTIDDEENNLQGKNFFLPEDLITILNGRSLICLVRIIESLIQDKDKQT